jgi:hypothetical protein
LAAQEHSSGRNLARSSDRILQTFAILCRLSGARWAEVPILAKGEIAAQDKKTSSSEGFG